MYLQKKISKLFIKKLLKKYYHINKLRLFLSEVHKSNKEND